MVSPQGTERKLLAPIPENIPDELKKRPQWVSWRIEMRKNKKTGKLEPTKVPYQHTGRRASATDLATWSSFEDALSAHESGSDGIGFVFSSGDPYTGIDLDKVVNPETGEIKPEAQEIMGALDGYQELSPSGTGVHIIVRGKIPSGHKNRADGWIEVYSQERFFTMTGRVI
jgi:putative DNA primase/helicase